MQKFKAAEHAVVHKLRSLGFHANRTGYTQGRDETADILAEKGRFSLLIDVKSTSNRKDTRRTIEYEWLQKVVEQARRQGRVPALVFNFVDRCYMVAMPLEEFSKLLDPDLNGILQAGASKEPQSKLDAFLHK